MTEPRDAETPVASADLVAEYLRTLGTEIPMPSVARWLGELVGAATAAWPELELDPVAFVRFLAERVRGGEAPARPAAAEAPELYIAFGCATGAPGALAAFERRYFAAARRAAARMGLSADQVQEVLQLLRQRLLMGRPGEPPKIVGYAGRGDFSHLVSVAAVRAGMDLLRRAGRDPVQSAGAGLDDLTDPADDPELAWMKQTHRAAFKSAFEAAVAGVSRRERALLRLHLLDHLNIDQIATIYRVHRATAARWLSHARRHVAEATRTRLSESLALAGDEFDALLAEIESRLDLSISRVLSTSTPGEPA